MKNCPNCNELIGDSVEICFNCRYNFRLHRVESQEEREQYKVNVQKEEEQRKRQLEKVEAEKQQMLLRNPLYEYCTEYLFDGDNGVLAKHELDDTLEKYARDGWRLHSIVLNEAGKNSSSVSNGLVSMGVNATMDVTILVFERCIKPAEF